MSTALFERDGERFLPSAHTRGPWNEAAQHGGPPAALLARAMEAVTAPVPMRIVRFTMDILRPVPLRPLFVAADAAQSGTRVQLLTAMLRDEDGTELCRASAWRLRVTDLGADLDAASHLPFSGPDDSEVHLPESDAPAFHRTGVELRFARGRFVEIGPATVWIRLRRDVVEGETPSPLMRAVAAADFGNGVASALEWGRYLFINTDLAVHMQRSPEGDWICLDAATAVNREGTGLAESRLYDQRGRIGRSLQTLLIDTLQRASG